jgi:hypothetical protein
MRHLIDVKYEARVTCTGRPGYEHAWIEGTLNKNNQYMIHLCDVKDGKFIHSQIFIRPEEFEELRSKIIEMKRRNREPGFEWDR